MKRLFFLLFSFAAISVSAQSKWNYSTFNNVMELEGTEYMITSITNNSKVSVKGRVLLFINTSTGESNEITFPTGTYINKLEHVKIDSLGINKVVIIGETKETRPRKMIPFNAPMQVVVCSVDGTNKQQITDDSFFVITCEVNKKTGVLVITGYRDTNDNMKRDKGDKPEILLYSLKEMKQIGVIEKEEF